MTVLLGLGDSHGDGVHSLRILEGSGVLSGVVPDRNEDGGILGPSSCGNAGRTHLMWSFRIICWSTGGGRAGQRGCEGIWDPGEKPRKPEPYRRDSLGEGWSMGRKEITQGKEPIVGGSGCSSSGKKGGCWIRVQGQRVGEGRDICRTLIPDGWAHLESQARKSVWGEV